MFFYAVLIIKKIFSMLKVCPEPKDRRSIAAQEGSMYTGEFESADEDIAEPQRVLRWPFKEGTTERREGTVLKKITKLSIEPQGYQLVEQADGISQVCSPNHLLRRRQFHPHSTVTRNPPKGSTFHARFHEYWCHQGVIGEGGDGVVHLYQQPKQRGMYIAVKLPRYSSVREGLVQEITNMQILGRHEHILGLCFASDDWYPCGPALFLPFCELGNLIAYRESWCAQQEWEGQPVRISEITMWKLFRDMVLALNYLHNELGTRYVHNDFKPQNVLAVVPPDQIGGQTLPEEPIFKLSDFARLTPWPTPKGQHPQGFEGTPEYAPPRLEQIAPVHPSADIWGLGATLQFMALGIVPIQSREAFIRSRKAQGKTYPGIYDQHEWMLEYWRYRIPIVFRPINVPLNVLRKDYDLPYDIPGYHPYGARLGYWYAQLWKPVMTRPKASKLVAQAIPHMDDMVKRLKLERIKQLRQDEEYGALHDV